MSEVVNVVVALAVIVFVVKWVAGGGMSSVSSVVSVSVPAFGFSFCFALFSCSFLFLFRFLALFCSWGRGREVRYLFWSSGMEGVRRLRGR